MEKKQKRHSVVLFLTKEASGGLGEFLNQLEGLRETGFGIEYLLYNRTAADTFRGMAYVAGNRYPRHARFSLEKIIFLLRNLRLTRSHITGLDPDLVVACDMYSMVLLSFLRIFGLRPKTALHFNIDILALIRSKGKPFSLFLELLARRILPVNDGFFCVSSGLAEKMVKEFRLDASRMVVVNSGITARTSSAGKARTGTGAFTLVTAGRLGWPKDYRTIIDALEAVPGASARLRIIGDGPDRESVGAYARSRGLGNRIMFLGWQKDVMPQLAKGDVFVFSSLSDAFPRVVLEALYLGLPVVATDCDFGPREILDGGKYGFLVPPGDSRAMAEAISTLMRDGRRRRKYAGLARVRAKAFSKRRMLEKYATLFDRITHA